MATPTIAADLEWDSTGAGVWVDVYGGIDVAPGATVKIQLKERTAGAVVQWRLELIGRDAGVAGFTFTATPGSTLGFYQFTAPAASAAGSMLMFRSIVNHGMAQAILTIYVLGTQAPAWTAATAKALGDLVRPTSANANGRMYVCIAAGNTHAATEPTWPTDAQATVVDNTVRWQVAGYVRNLSLQTEGHGLGLVSPYGTFIVQDFGGGTIPAVASGIPTPKTRDDVAFAEAIAVLFAAGGGELHAPAGRYVLTRSLDPLPPGSTLRGDGPGNGLEDGTGTLLDFTGVGRAFYAYEAEGTNSTGRVTIRDLWIRNIIPAWKADSVGTGLTVAAGRLVVPRQGSNNGLIYQCTAAGTTNTGAQGEPRWRTKLGSSTTDGTGLTAVTWTAFACTGSSVPTWGASRAVTVNTLIAPTTPSGHIYRCTKAGVTDPAIEPGWTDDLGDLIPDGTAEWTPRHGLWVAGKDVDIGDRVMANPATNGHIYECTNPGTTTAQPAFLPIEGEPYIEAAGTVEWIEVGVIGNAAEALYQVATWSPGWNVVVDQLCVPTVPNGHYYRCITAGVTDATEPGVTIGSVTTPGNWPVTAVQAAQRTAPDQYSMEIADGTAVWIEAGRVPIGVECILGTSFKLERVTVSGFQLAVFLAGVEGADIDALADGAVDQFSAGGIPFNGGVPTPSPMSVGVMIGANAYPNTTNAVIVRSSHFNAMETSIWDFNDVNHKGYDNIGQLGDFGIFGRVSGPNCSSWENNATGDATKFTRAVFLVDGRPANLTLRSNFIGVAANVRRPGLVFEGTGPVGLTLADNAFECGYDDPADPAARVHAVEGLANVTNAASIFGNTFAFPEAAFDADPVGSALAVNMSPERARVGINTVRPVAGLDVFHDPNFADPRFNQPALTLRTDDEAPYAEHWLLHSNALFKQARRHRTRLSNNPAITSMETGSVTLLESLKIGGAMPAGTAAVCRFKIAPDTNLLVHYRVIARQAGGAGFGLDSWVGHGSYYRDGAAALTQTAAPVQEYSMATGAVFATPPALQAAAADDAIELLLTGVDDDSEWESELRLLVVSAFIPALNITMASIAGGTLTIDGVDFLTYGVETTSVFVYGTGARFWTEADISGNGGTLSNIQIVIPMSGAAVGSVVRVYANRKMSNVTTVV